MPLSPEDLQHIAERTLAHYEQHAHSYWEGTREHDVSQNIAALLKHMPGLPPFDLLDLGCGPGRDLRTFRALGHRAVGLERAPTAAARCWSRAC
jgi:SAM-dependent methyltransferase